MFTYSCTFWKFLWTVYGWLYFRLYENILHLPWCWYPTSHGKLDLFFLLNLIATVHFWAIWPLVDSCWALHDCWPHQCITLQSGVLPTKFGGHRAFLRQFDLWMTFDLWYSPFKNMLSNLMGPSSTPKPTFSERLKMALKF